MTDEFIKNETYVSSRERRFNKFTTDVLILAFGTPGLLMPREPYEDDLNDYFVAGFTTFEAAKELARLHNN